MVKNNTDYCEILSFSVRELKSNDQTVTCQRINNNNRSVTRLITIWHIHINQCFLFPASLLFFVSICTMIASLVEVFQKIVFIFIYNKIEF